MTLEQYVLLIDSLGLLIILTTNIIQLYKMILYDRARQSEVKRIIAMLQDCF